MRAKMSDRAARLTCAYMPGDPNDSCGRAEREARAILAETEPGMLALVGTPYEQSVPLWCATLRRDPDNRARRALADALRAFVED